MYHGFLPIIFQDSGFFSTPLMFSVPEVSVLLLTSDLTPDPLFRNLFIIHDFEVKKIRA